MQSPRTLSGPWLVAGMFLFATLVTAGLWTYWELHTRPYRPLTDALGAQFPGSNPRVEGGKHGLHKQTPRVLRIVMRVDFDPVDREEAFQQQAAAVLQRAADFRVLSDFDQCEIHLFLQRPEQSPRLRTAEFPASEFPAPREQPAP